MLHKLIFHSDQTVELGIEQDSWREQQQFPLELKVYNIDSFYDFAEIEALIFFTFFDNFEFFADIKNLSRPPLKSTVLKAAFATFNFIFFFSMSLLKVTFFKLGRNLLLVLFFAWLTLWPLSGDIPVSSHLLDIKFH